MFTFTDFVQKIDFERPQFKRMGVAFTEFYLFKMSSLLVLEENCFKARKAPLDEKWV